MPKLGPHAKNGTNPMVQKKSSVPEKFSLVYSAVSLVNRSSRQDPTRGRKKSGDISPPPSRYRNRV